MVNKITSGIWFVFIGLVLLLHNIGVIHFNVWPTLRYWPLLVIILGINLIFQNKIFGKYIKIGCNILFLGWILYVGLSDKDSNWIEYTVIRDKASGAGVSAEQKVQTRYTDAIREAHLEFNGAGGTFQMQGAPGEYLVSAESKDGSMGMDIKTTEESSKKQITINAKPTTQSKKKNRASITLHSNVLWDLHLNYGAANIQSDLSHLKLKTMELNTGASNINFTLGRPRTGISKIDISTGASNINLRIPKDAAAKVSYTAILSKNSFEGFETNKKGVAKTANYDKAANKYDIELEGAANNFKISRY